MNLPDDSLTKEIKLTQDLMQLFIKYQIPTDLLSFDGMDSGMEITDASVSEKLEVVKGHVKAMHQLIEKSKTEELEARQMEREYLAPRMDLLGGLDGGLDEGLGNAWGCDLDNGLENEWGAARRSSTPPKGRPMMRSAPAPLPVARGAYRCAAPPPPGAASAPRPAAAAAPAPAPAPTAPPPPPAPAQRAVQQATQDRPSEATAGAAATGTRDYTQVPREMDRRFEELDTDGALRPTIIKPSDVWTKRAQKALLAAPSTSTLRGDEQKQEKDAAFDLLDALTKSGALPVERASLHIVVAATHCFDKTVTETVVQDNVNPIDKVERSTLIMASTVHQQPPAVLVREAQQQRVRDTSPMLFLADAK